MTRKYWLTAFVGLCMTTACGDDSTATSGTETDTDPTASTTVSTTVSSTTDMTTGDPDSSTDATTTVDPDSSTGEPTGTGSTTGEPGGPADFVVRIENISDASVLPTPFSPGVWVEQEFGAQPLFAIDVADAGLGLESLAEDGDPGPIAAGLADAVGVIQVDTFDTPEGAGAAAPIFPGEAFEFTFTAQNGSRLSLATMLGQSNDLFVATGPQGVALFTNSGAPQPARDISSLMVVYDLGTEANQPPAMGGYQAASQLAANTGPSEAGEVYPFAQSTRSLPQAARFTRVDVTIDPKTGVFTIEIPNASDEWGSFVTPFSPAVWALHDDTFTLFEQGVSAAGFTGLQALAEDGNPAPWEAAISGAAGVNQSDVTAAPALPGGAIEIVVTPAVEGRFFSFATMLGETNDAFLAPEVGVALLDENGLARNTGDIEADIEAALTVWDAGTEINEIPGIGGNQAPRQVGSTGAADPIDLIRPYIDATNDLAGEGLNGFLDVEIVNGGTPGDFTVTVTNNSGGSAYGVAGRLSPILYVVHDDTAALFEQAAGASLGLEELAEDGDPTSLFSEVEALGAAVSDFAIVDTPDGGVPGALSDGETYSFDITASADFPLLSFAGMVAPSNDTFAAFGPGGVSLFNGATPLTDEELATAVAGALAAWDAGTEANQAGGRGRDMVPFQAAPGDGLPEGTGIVRNAETDPVWTYPEAARLISVTVSPVR